MGQKKCASVPLLEMKPVSKLLIQSVTSWVGYVGLRFQSGITLIKGVKSQMDCGFAFVILQLYGTSMDVTEKYPFCFCLQHQIQFLCLMESLKLLNKARFVTAALAIYLILNTDKCSN